MREVRYSTLFGDANLNALYRLDDLNDSSGNGRNLTDTGTVPFNPAKFGNGADQGSNNTTKWLRNTSFGSFTLSDPFSVSFWIKINSEPGTNADTYPFDFQRSDGTNAKQFRVIYQDVSGTKNLKCRVYTNSYGDITYSVTLGTVNFYHIVFMYNGTTGSELYFQNASVGTGVITDSQYGLATSSLSVGVSEAISLPSSAIIDDVAVFNRLLTAVEINQLFSFPHAASAINYQNPGY